MRASVPGRAATVLLALLTTSACFPVSYLAQAAAGEVELLGSARSLPRVLRDPAVPAETRRQLFRVEQVEAFGRAHGLKPTGNYRRFSDLHRSAAVWVVQACAPLSFEVRHWSFPIVGSVPYLGFFSEAEAHRYADRVAAEEALDVEVRPASAFSTLGWFSDPLLSTMLGTGAEAPGDLADTILHESVHATVYVPGQSAFNESLASFVADRLTRRWFARPGANAEEARAWIAAESQRASHRAALHRAYEELDALYRSARPEADKRSAKETVLEALRVELKWRRRPNNASLAGYRVYDTGSAAFEKLLRTCGGDEARLLAAVGTLREGDFERPQQEDFSPVVLRLAGRGCPGRATVDDRNAHGE